MTCTGVNMAPRPDVTCHLVTALNSLCGRLNRAGDVVHNPGVLLPPRPRFADVHAPATLSASVPLAVGSTPGVLVGSWLDYALMLGGLAAIGWAWRRA